MTGRKPRWFTCTPVAFGGGPDFFARDSGLMCRGLQAAGCESMAVMPGPPQDGDDISLIRTDFPNLESPEWWRTLGLDGVVLYAWGSPKFRKVAAAIHDAGIFLVLNQDNGGFISPLAGFHGWIEEQRIMSGGGSGFLKRLARGLAGLVVTDPPRAAHLRNGDVIACVSPAAAERYRTLCRFYGGSALANRVAMIPHPVESGFRLGSPAEKIRQVSCVGRWQDHLQKRPALMQEVIQQLVTGDADVRAEIAGSITLDLATWHAGLPENQRERVVLRGRLERGPLMDMLGRSQVFYSASAFESFGIAAGEALCCGCTVVAACSPSMAAFEWFVSKDSGRLAERDDAAGHLAALRKELASWSSGRRDAAAISSGWSDLLHEHQVAARVLGLRDTRGQA